MASITRQKTVEVPAGTISYQESGSGAPVVFVHGLLQSGRLWRKVVPEIASGSRCIVPTLPLGSHEHPMNPDADLTPEGVAKTIADFLAALDLRDVTLVGNDSGGGLCQIVVTEYPERVSKLVLTDCDAFDNFPPKLFNYLIWGSRVPGFLLMMGATMRIRPLRRLPIAFGWVTKRPVPNDVTDADLRPFQTSAEIRRDTAKFLAGLPSKAGLRAAEKLAGFDGPVLITWAPEDKLFPIEHGRRLAEIFPNARLEEIPDSYTFVSEDQPELLAKLMREFLAESSSTELRA